LIFYTPDGLAQVPFFLGAGVLFSIGPAPQNGILFDIVAQIPTLSGDLRHG